MGRKRKNGEGTAQLRKDGLPKTKNVLAKTKGECVDKLKTLKDTMHLQIRPRFGQICHLGSV